MSAEATGPSYVSWERVAIGVALVALFVLLASLVQIGRLEAQGPPHASLELPGGIPATLYVPGPGSAAGLPDPGSEHARAPVVVLAHAFAADQAVTSGAARTLASAGYAVLTLAFRGHGANRNPFFPVWGRGDILQEELAAAVAYVRASPYVDGSKVVLMGHSMGAWATLAYATRDASLSGVILVSGGGSLAGEHRAPNTLFLYAEADPEFVRAPIVSAATRLVGNGRLDAEVTYGSFAERTAVRYGEIAGTDHVSIILSDRTVAQAVDWLDRVFERRRVSPFVSSDERRAPTAIAMVAFVLLVPGLGVAASRAVAPMRRRPAREGLAGLAWLAAALLVSMPLIATGEPVKLIALEIGDLVITYFAIAGSVLILAMFVTGRLPDDVLAGGAPRILGVAALVVGAVCVLFTPMPIAFHRLTLTPERLAVWALATLLIAPFGLSLHWLLRRGSPLAAISFSLAGHLMVIGALALGVFAGVLPGQVLHVVPILLGLILLFELLNGSIYACTRNTTVPGLLESALLAWVLAAVLPIRI